MRSLFGSTQIPLKYRDSFFHDDSYFSDTWADLERLDSLFDLRSSNHARREAQARPEAQRPNQEQFKVILDVKEFKPEEISVTTNSETNCVIVEGKHEEKTETDGQAVASKYGSVSRQFTRKYVLPSNVQLDQVQCNFSKDGVLQITAPRTASASVSSSEQTQTQTASVAGSQVPSANSAATESTSTASSSSLKSASHRNLEDELGGLGLGLSSSNSNSMLDRSIWDPFFHASWSDLDLPPIGARRRPALERFRSVEDAAASTLGIQSAQDNFEVLVDVRQFNPEELSLTSAGRFLIVEAKHEEKSDSCGSISRHFTRKYEMPAGVRAEDIICQRQANGILKITCRASASSSTATASQSDAKAESTAAAGVSVSLGERRIPIVPCGGHLGTTTSTGTEHKISMERQGQGQGQGQSQSQGQSRTAEGVGIGSVGREAQSGSGSGETNIDIKVQGLGIDTGSGTDKVGLGSANQTQTKSEAAAVASGDGDSGQATGAKLQFDECIRKPTEYKDVKHDDYLAKLIEAFRQKHVVPYQEEHGKEGSGNPEVNTAPPPTPATAPAASLSDSSSGAAAGINIPISRF